MMLSPSLLLLTVLAAEPAPAAPGNTPGPTPDAAAAEKAAAPAKPVKGGKATVRPAAPRASLPSLEGEVEAIDHRAHHVRIRTASGSVELSFDRDTFIFATAGAVTPLAIALGMQVRVGRDGDARAAWIELRPAASSAPTSTPAAAP